MADPTIDSPLNLWTVPEMGRELSIDHTTIYRTIARLGILHDAETQSGFRMYRGEVLEQLRAHFQAKAATTDPGK